MFGQQYSDSEWEIEAWYTMAIHQISIFEPVLMPLRLQSLSPPTSEAQANEHIETNSPICKVMTIEHIMKDLIDNGLQYLLLMVDFIQTRACALELLDKLGTLTKKLREIECGLVQSQTHGTYQMIKKTTMTWILTMDPMKVVETIYTVSINISANQRAELRNPLS